MESFNDWIQHYHHGQPSRPAPPEGGSFTDRVAYEHRMKQYDQERERWHHNLLMQTQVLFSLLQDIYVLTSMRVGGGHLNLPLVSMPVRKFCDNGGKLGESVSYGHISSFSLDIHMPEVASVELGISHVILL